MKPLEIVSWNQFRAALEAELSELLAPELKAAGGTQVYIIGASEAGIVNPPWLATTNPRMAETYRDTIGDRWSGPGPGMLIDDQTCRFTDDPSENEFAAGFAVAPAVHELSHIARDPTPFLPMSGDPDRASAQLSWLRNAASATGPQSPGEAALQFMTHHSTWIRLAIHIAHRLRVRGWWVPIVNAWPIHELSRPELYAELLNDEPIRLSGLPLSEISALPVPDAVQSLWLADVHRFENDMLESREE